MSAQTHGSLSLAFPLVALKRVKGPDGSALLLSDLPPANTIRWVARRKAEVVVAVRGGLITAEQACRRYSLTAAELVAWQRAYQLSGTLGLRVKADNSRAERDRRARISNGELEAELPVQGIDVATALALSIRK